MEAAIALEALRVLLLARCCSSSGHESAAHVDAWHLVLRSTLLLHVLQVLLLLLDGRIDACECSAVHALWRV